MDFDQKYPPSVAVAVSKLLSTIKQKSDHSKELKNLKDQCCYSDPCVSKIAMTALLNLVKDSVLDSKDCLTDFLTILTTTSCSTDMAYLINNLLLLDQKLDNDDYECDYNLRLPQHPLLVMLNRSTNFWPSICSEVKYVFYSSNHRLYHNYHKLYKPLYLYVICHPDEHFLNSFREELWDFLLGLKNSDKLLKELLCWMPLNPSNTKLLVNLPFANFNRELIVLWSVSLLPIIFLRNSEPRFLIGVIGNELNVRKKLRFSNCFLLMLADCIRKCAAVHLEQVLGLCKLIVLRKDSSLVVLQTVKASLLQWIANPSILTAGSVQKSKELILLIGESQNTSMKIEKHLKDIKELIPSNKNVYSSIQVCILLENWQSEEDILEWLELLHDCSSSFIIEIIPFLYGLFLLNHPPVQIKVLDCILSNLELSKDSSWIKSEVLTLVLYVLSNSVDSELHFKLLKSLPNLIGSRDSLQKIMATVQALRSGQGRLTTFACSLLFDLWKVEIKFYPYLEKAFFEDFNSKIHPSEWEFFTTRSHILKELCIRKPELYGKEMVAHLSKILNETNNLDLASAFAIDGIAVLCKNEIIDAVTTWEALSPMINQEKRPLVIKSICQFISEMSTLNYLDTYPKLLEQILGKLFEYIASGDPEIVKTALDALVAFDLEQISMHLPEEYLQDEDKRGAPIPGNFWIQFMEKIAYLNIVGDFLIKMVAKEISGYLKYVYQVKGSREPASYTNLPSTSIVRALGQYIKVETHSEGFSKPVFLECLRILSQEYSKPLPPLDWCFLQELYHQKDAKHYCTNIASHQVIISGTARRFMENIIVAVTQDHSNMEYVMNIYGNLKYLANSIQPVTLKPFLEITFKSVLNTFEKNSEDLLEILECLRKILENKDIQETNKIVIANVLIAEIETIDDASNLFDILTDVVPLFPSKIIREITSPQSVNEITPGWYRKALKIRTKVALNTQKSPLEWLDDIIEIGPFLNDPQIFREFEGVFRKHKNNTDCALWLLDMIGHIQGLINDKFELKKFLFLCDVFIAAVVTFSGHFVFKKDENIDLFPQAFAALLDVNHWSICTTQALEWLYHMNSEATIPPKYRQIFGQCLQALRHDDEFKKNMRWTKYLGCKITQ